MKIKKELEFMRIARKRFNNSVSADSENRDVHLHDKKFENNDQWSDEEKEKRKGRPTVTINKIAGSVKGILGDARQNRPRITVIPVDDHADPMIAEILQGIIRNIENRSDAEQAYDNGHADAVRGNIGYWRIVRDWENDNVFDQTLRIERIVNPLAVHYDQGATKPDYTDAEYVFVDEVMDKDAFIEKYPEISVSDWDHSSGEAEAGWFTDDSVRIAEYYYKEYYTKHIFQLTDGRVIEVRKPKIGKVVNDQGLSVDAVTGESTETDPETEKPYKITVPIPFVKRRSVESYKIMQCKINGNEVIEDPIEWPSRYFPIIPCLGEEVWIDGKRHLRSAFRHSIDAQKLYNWARSNHVETLALSPKQPYVFFDKQLGPYKSMWDKANTKPMPYLLLKYVEGLPYPQRLTGSSPDQGALQEAAVASDDIKATIGRYDASLGNQGNEQTGIAIRERKMQGDSSTYIYTDNQMFAIKHTGRVLLDLIPRIWDTERVVRLLGEDLQKTLGQNPMVKVAGGGDSAWTTVNVRNQNGEIVAHDLSMGEYDVVIDAGPGFATRRQEAAASMVEMSRAMPQAAQILLPRIAKNSDWPEAQEIAQELQQQMNQPPQPDPVQELMMAERQTNLEKSQLQVQKGQIDMQKGQLDIQRKEAELVTSAQKGQLDIEEKKLELAKDAQQLAAEGAKLNPEMVYRIAQKAVVDVLKALK